MQVSGVITSSFLQVSSLRSGETQGSERDESGLPVHERTTRTQACTGKPLVMAIRAQRTSTALHVNCAHETGRRKQRPH